MCDEPGRSRGKYQCARSAKHEIKTEACTDDASESRSIARPVILRHVFRECGTESEVEKGEIPKDRSDEDPEPIEVWPQLVHQVGRHY